VYTRLLSDNPNGGAHSEDLGIDEEIILEWNLGKLVRCEMESFD
jgi:hypothetical protein